MPPWLKRVGKASLSKEGRKERKRGHKMDEGLDNLDALLARTQVQPTVEDMVELRRIGRTLKRGVRCLNCDKAIWSKHGRKLYCDEKCKDAMKYRRRRAKEGRFRVVEQMMEKGNEVRKEWIQNK